MNKYLVNIYAEVGRMVGENGGAEGITKVADVFVLRQLEEGEDANTPDVAKELKNNTWFSYLDYMNIEMGADSYTIAFGQGCVVDGEEVDMPEEDIAAAIEDGECIVWCENEDVFVRLDKKQVAKNKLLAKIKTNLSIIYEDSSHRCYIQPFRTVEKDTRAPTCHHAGR